MAQPAVELLALATTLLLLHGCMSQKNPIKEALLLHNEAFSNASFEDCVWRREKEPCPDPDVKLHLYTEAEPIKKPASKRS